MLVLEVDASNAPEGGVQFKVELESAMEMRGVEVRVKDVTTMSV